ncbi:hypothetical protein I302_100966 [Kwoniella bestiolae CBS 10118]|uniref:Uncharacterized protein n=1 Tax=Kwoniella bestiolae CBS 10118 TaxID=1296100 RepID=A0A1B9G6J5_9TREE|nr:hypothetical protein I302_04344 [Kwoniella bestiolae CBS 10118]OCF26657.1 hypothetical protein I302_04344 [Kwoniella bestiolae CBS 10118]
MFSLQSLIYLSIPLILLLLFPTISQIYLTLIPPLLVLLTFLFLSYIIFYPIHYLYTHPTFFPDLFESVKSYILNEPRRVLWRIEVSLHLRTRDVYPGMYDIEPPYPTLWPEADHYIRLRRIVGLCIVAIKQVVWDWLDIPYGYYAEEIIERRKKEKEEGKGKGWWSWRKGEEYDQQQLLTTQSGPGSPHINVPIYPPPPPYQPPCTCSTSCELHPTRYILETDCMLPKGTIVIPPVQWGYQLQMQTQQQTIYSTSTWNLGYESVTSCHHAYPGHVVF